MHSISNFLFSCPMCLRARARSTVGFTAAPTLSSKLSLARSACVCLCFLSFPSHRSSIFGCWLLVLHFAPVHRANRIVVVVAVVVARYHRHTPHHRYVMILLVTLLISDYSFPYMLLLRLAQFHLTTSFESRLPRVGPCPCTVVGDES